MSAHKIVVVTDSAAFISEKARGGLHIPVIPHWIIWDNERLRDGVDVDPLTLYRRLQESKTLPTTSEPLVEDYVDFFRQVAAEEQVDTIVVVPVSSGLGRSLYSAREAQAQFPELTIRIVDSVSVSMAQGFSVLAAARAAAAGRSLDQVVAAVEIMRTRAHLLFVVETLEYLHRGGRIGGARRLLGTALQIKPLLRIRGGRIEPLAQVRTKDKAIATMLDIAEEWLDGKRMVEAAVVDVASPDEADAVAEQVRERFDIAVVYRSPISPAIGTHVGPGTIGFAFHTVER